MTESWSALIQVSQTRQRLSTGWLVGFRDLGALVAYEVAGQGAQVVVAERKAAGDKHSTGRFAAVVTECYAAPAARRLATGSRSYSNRPRRAMCAHVPLAGSECLGLWRDVSVSKGDGIRGPVPGAAGADADPTRTVTLLALDTRRRAAWRH